MSALLQKLRLGSPVDAAPSAQTTAALSPTASTIRRIATGRAPFPRHGHSTVIAANGKELLLFGGMGRANYGHDFNDTENRVPTNAARSENAGMLNAGKFSNTTTGTSTLLADVCVLSLSGLGSWSPSVECKGIAPSPRLGHAAAMLPRNRMLVFGGVDARRQYDEQVYVLNADTHVWSRPRVVGDAIPRGRRGHALAVVGSMVYISGGVSGEQEGYLGDLFVLDAEKMQWRKLASMPNGTARAHHSMIALNDRELLVYGGDCGYECLDDLLRYDLATDRWITVDVKQQRQHAIPDGRFGHGAFVHDGILYVAGGRDYRGTALAEVIAFDLKAKAWMGVVGMLPSPRSEHNICQNKDKIYIVGGMPEDVPATDALIVLDMAKTKGIKSPPVSPLSPHAPLVPPVRSTSAKKNGGGGRVLLGNNRPSSPSSPGDVPSSSPGSPPPPLPSALRISTAIPPSSSPYSASTITSPTSASTELAAVKRELALLRADYAELKADTILPPHLRATAAAPKAGAPSVEESLRSEMDLLRRMLSAKDAELVQGLRENEERYQQQWQTTVARYERDLAQLRHGDKGDAKKSAAAVTVLQKQVDKLMQENDRRASALENAETQMMDARQAQQKLKEENVTLREKISVLEQQLATASSAAPKESSQVKALRADLALATQRATQAEQSLAAARAEHDRMQSQLHNRQELVQEVERWKTAASRLEGEMKTLAEMQQAQQRQLIDQHKRLPDKLRRESARRSLTPPITTDALLALNREMDTLKAEVGQRREQVATLEARNTELAGVVGQYQQHARQIEAECERLEGELALTRQELEREQQKAYAVEIALKAELDRSPVASAGNDDAIAVLQDTVDGLRAEVDRLSTGKLALERELATMRGRIKQQPDSVNEERVAAKAAALSTALAAAFSPSKPDDDMAARLRDADRRATELAAELERARAKAARDVRDAEERMDMERRAGADRVRMLEQQLKEVDGRQRASSPAASPTLAVRTNVNAGASVPPPPPPPPPATTSSTATSPPPTASSGSPCKSTATAVAPSNLLAEIQAGKKLKKAPTAISTDGTAAGTQHVKAVPQDPMARMMAEMAARKLRKR